MYEKLSNTEAELKKVLLIKNKCVLEKSLTENFIFCAVLSLKEISNCYNLLGDFLRDFFFSFQGVSFLSLSKHQELFSFQGEEKGNIVSTEAAICRCSSKQMLQYLQETPFQASNFVRKNTPTRVFSGEYYEIFKNSILVKYVRWLLLSLNILSLNMYQLWFSISDFKSSAHFLK